MKNIVPALGKLQLACMDKSAPLADIGKARKELFAAIREAMLEGSNLIIGDDNRFPINPKALKAWQDYIAKFDKLNGD